MQNIQSIILATIQSLYDITLTENEIEITPAPKRELGEYCIGVFSLAKPLGKSPNIIATEIAIELAKHTDIFQSTSAIGGYVNFFLTDAVWIELFSKVSGQDFSASAIASARNDKSPPTIIVDYIGANAGKPLHIAHICTPSIGQVICNVYHHLGYRVIGDSHFGDWGGIFGKLIYAWKYEKEERIYTQIENMVRVRPLIGLREKGADRARNEKFEILLEEFGIDFILALYQSFHQIVLIEMNSFDPHAMEIEAGIHKKNEEAKNTKETLAREEFKKLAEGDQGNTELWKRFTSLSISEIEQKLDLLNVHATYNIGESFYEGLDLPRPNDEDYPDLKYTMKDVVRELIEKGIATQNEDGSVGVVFPEESKLSSCVLQKKDGTGLYLTSDLAAIRYRLTNGWNPEKIIYSVDVRQQLHLRQVFWIAEKAWGEELGAKDVEIFHAFNGFIKLKEGAMSTRHGTVIFLEALIDEGNERTQKILEEKGRVGEKALKEEDIQAITIAAIKYSYLAQDREKDVTFDWDKALSFEGNSGPYIQYAYVRAKKIAQLGIVNCELGISRLFTTQHSPLSSHDKSLIQILYRFDEIVNTVAKTYKPHHLALYAYDLAVVFNSFYVHTPKILEESDEGIRSFRLTLVQKTAEQLKKSFELLAIQMPSEM